MSSRSGQHKDSRNVLGIADSIENADTVIGVEHRRIHLGDLWNYHRVQALGANSGMAVRIVQALAELPLHVHFRTAMGGIVLSDYIVQVYEDSEWETPGEDVFGVNHNRRQQGSPPNVTFANPAFFSSGFLLYEAVVPAGHTFDTRDEEHEWITSIIDAPAGDFAVRMFNPNPSTAFLASINVDVYVGDGNEADVPK